jgi:hypothetical protein
MFLTERFAKFCTLRIKISADVIRISINHLKCIAARLIYYVVGLLATIPAVCVTIAGPILMGNLLAGGQLAASIFCCVAYSLLTFSP